MSGSSTSWQSGRLDSRKGPGQVLFGRMYEDAAIEQDVFAGRDRIMCIASAGCTAMTLSRNHEVVAVDVNPAQLQYARDRFQGDPGHPGKAERIMNMMRALGPLAGWWPSRVRAFIELNDPEEQMIFWSQRLNSWRFRNAMDLLLSARTLRAGYSRSLLASLPDQLGDVMRRRMERCFSRHPNNQNPYARALLLGQLSTDPPPPEASEIQLVNADAAEFLEQQPRGSFDGFTLSNILDGSDESYQRRLMAAVRWAGSPDALVVLRSFKDPGETPPLNLAADDRSMLWGLVMAEPIGKLLTPDGAYSR
ncbi:MAG: DUF3419 family protein [Rhodothermales bacterium]|nr:DUF3419 family protein [Rhodothermales bacterium]